MKIHGNKTYIAVIAGVLAAISAFLMQEISVIELVQMIVALIIPAFLRHGISKNGK